MKRIFLIMLTVFLNVTFFSCTSLDEDEYIEPVEQQDCCGETGNPPPPPPPPPGGGSGG